MPATRQRAHPRDRGFVAGFWDEVLTVAVEVAGVAGLVINGGVRDIAALATRRFPSFAPERREPQWRYLPLGNPVNLQGRREWR